MSEDFTLKLQGALASTLSPPCALCRKIPFIIHRPRGRPKPGYEGKNDKLVVSFVPLKNGVNDRTIDGR